MAYFRWVLLVELVDESGDQLLRILSWSLMHLTYLGDFHHLASKCFHSLEISLLWKEKFSNGIILLVILSRVHNLSIRKSKILINRKCSDECEWEEEFTVPLCVRSTSKKKTYLSVREFPTLDFIHLLSKREEIYFFVLFEVDAFTSLGILLKGFEEFNISRIVEFCMGDSYDISAFDVTIEVRCTKVWNLSDLLVIRCFHC